MRKTKQELMDMPLVAVEQISDFRIEVFAHISELESQKKKTLTAVHDLAEVNSGLIDEASELESPQERWIACADRLPDEDGEYLVLANDIVKQWMEVRRLKTHHRKIWVDDDGFSSWPPIVTHWMPLPSPP